MTAQNYLQLDVPSTRTRRPPNLKSTSSASPVNSNMQQSNLSQLSFPGREPESPATLTNLTITNSIKSDVSLVKDPEFWRRFSVAIHQDEEQARQPEREKTESESWLARQRKKNHRSKVWGFLIALIIVLIACGAGIAIWLLSKNNWLRKDTPHADHTQS